MKPRKTPKDFEFFYESTERTGESTLGLGLGLLHAAFVIPTFVVTFVRRPKWLPALVGLVMFAGLPLVIWLVFQRGVEALYTFTTIPLLIWLALLRVSGSVRWTIPRRPFAQTRVPSATTRMIPRSLLRWALAVWSLALLVFPLFTYCRLCAPHPIPVENFPRDNGMPEVLIIGRASEEKGRPITDEQLSRVHALAELPLYVQMIYERGDVGLPDLMGIRTMARALRDHAGLMCLQGDSVSATRDFRTGMRLGVGFPHGGLFMHQLVGNALEGLSLSNLPAIEESLSPAQCQQLIDELRVLDQQREPCQLIVARELAWQDHALGWAGRLIASLHEWHGERNDYKHQVDEWTEVSRAWVQVAITRLAIRGFQLEQQRLPESLDELTPRYLAEVPMDPLSGGPLIYRRTGDSYTVYSVGTNRRDDGGKDVRADIVLTPFDEK